jgi:predicted Rossmann fold flavoprotein
LGENDCVIVGGGAAGLATAIFAARQATGRQIVVLDGAKKLGAKILISGGGRCNVTNDVVAPEDYCGGSRHVIRRVLAALPVEQTIAWFRELGVALHVEAGGKLFPDSHRARSVLDALIAEANRLGIQIFTGNRVTALTHQDGLFRITTTSDSQEGCTLTRRASEGAVTWEARRVVLATGGLSVPKTGSDGAGYCLAQALGHSTVPTTPALVGLLLAGDFHAALSGLSHDVEIAVRGDGISTVCTRGSLLWTHFGVSGPAVLDISRHWHRAELNGQTATVSINMLPGLRFDSGDRRLVELSRLQPRSALHNALATLVPARLADALLAKADIDPQQPVGQLGRDDRRKILTMLIDLPLPVRASRGYQYAEVTAGGVPLDEINPATMESRKCPGLYLVGEILDVDGRIGGFNFQWAWSSAWVAAKGVLDK